VRISGACLNYRAMEKHADIIKYWFEGRDSSFWFRTNPEVDSEIMTLFGGLVAEAQEGQLDGWKKTSHGRLALIILLDQFSRNIFRGSKQAFEGDAKARALVLEGMKIGADIKLSHDEKCFYYMPLMHAEDKEMQEKSIEIFRSISGEEGESYKYACWHKELIDRFGRFPSRNEALGRESTIEELEFLSEQDQAF
jgi:uncharacterized protein (DUF924 family)